MAVDRFLQQGRTLAVEAGERLVEQQHLRLRQEGHRDPQPLALSHRHPVDAPAFEFTEVEDVDRGVDDGPHLPRRDERDTGPELELTADREAGVQAAVPAGRKATRRWIVRAALGGGEPPGLGAPAFRVDQPGGDPQHRRLPSPVAPADPGAGADVEVEVDVLEDRWLVRRPAFADPAQGERHALGAGRLAPLGELGDRGPRRRRVHPRAPAVATGRSLRTRSSSSASDSGGSAVEALRRSSRASATRSE